MDYADIASLETKSQMFTVRSLQPKSSSVEFVLRPILLSGLWSERVNLGGILVVIEIAIVVKAQNHLRYSTVYCVMACTAAKLKHSRRCESRLPYQMVLLLQTLVIRQIFPQAFQEACL